MCLSVKRVHILIPVTGIIAHPLLVFIDRYPGASGEIILTIFTLYFFDHTGFPQFFLYLTCYRMAYRRLGR